MWIETVATHSFGRLWRSSSLSSVKLTLRLVSIKKLLSPLPESRPTFYLNNLFLTSPWVISSSITATSTKMRSNVFPTTNTQNVYKITIVSTMYGIPNIVLKIGAERFPNLSLIRISYQIDIFPDISKCLPKCKK